MEANAAASPVAAEAPAFLPELRKRLTTFLAQRLTLSLFVAGREQELRQAISRLVAVKLAEERVALDEKNQASLIEELMEGLPKRGLTPPPEEKQPATWTVESLRAHVAPYIAEHLGNHLFQPGREAQLAEAVYILVQEKIRVDGIEVDEVMRRRLMEVICEAMSIPLPSALNPQIPSPVKVETPPPPRPPPLAVSGEGEGKSETRKLEVAADGENALQAGHPLDPELRRKILLHMASRLKPDILASGRPEAAQVHVAELLGGAVLEFRVRLTEEEREEILATILSGEGLEFQL